jgi:hypothetical protein
MLKKLLALSKTKLGIVLISSIAVVAIVLIVINVIRNNEPSESVLSFCETYPNAIVCTDEDSTFVEIAYDTFDTILAHYPNVMDETFCTLYFTGNLSQYCLNDFEMIFPNGFSSISSNYYIEEVDEGIFDVYTEFSSGNPAYIIRLGMVEIDGVYKVSGFSFVDAPPIVDLALTPNDINTYMTTMIQASTNPLSTFCTTYFISKALQDCENNPEEFRFDGSAIYHFDLVSVITNDYFYLVRNQNNTITYQYHIEFIEENDTIIISDLSVKILE